MAHTYAIGIDVGATNTDIGMVRDDGAVIGRANLSTSDYTDFRLYIGDVVRQMRDVMSFAAVYNIEGIGIGAPNANYYTGCVVDAANLKMRGVLDFEKEIHRHINVPVAVSNDANAAAYGEMVFGGARGMNNFIMFTIGTGVGSGIVVNGQLLHGVTGCAGELGHSVLIPDGRQCTCGRKGCLEAYVSARGIVQTFCELRREERFRTVEGALIGESVADADITSKMIGAAANGGDPVAMATYEQTGRLLGIAMANSVCFSSPQAIFIMGGPAKVGEPLMKPLRKAFNENLLATYRGSCDVYVSKLKENDAAILGAAALVKAKKNRL